MPLRARVKRALEKAVADSGLPALGPRLHRGKVAILSYHNVVPDSDPPLGDTSLHLPVSHFREQMDLLADRFQVVPLQDLLPGAGSSRDGPSDGHRAGSAEPKRIRVAVTFDDAYRGALEVGLPELASRGLPATIFVCPGLLGSEGFWWDCLADPSSGVVPLSVRDHVLGKLGGRREKAMAWARGEGLSVHEMSGLYRPGTGKEVEDASSAFVSLASHTWSHVNLATVPEKEAAEEMEQPLSWLRERGVEGPVPLSYPYGLSSEGVRETAELLGYAAGLRVEGGLTASGTLRKRPFLIPRLNIPRGLSREGFLARLSGVWPW